MNPSLPLALLLTVLSVAVALAVVRWARSRAPHAPHPSKPPHSPHSRPPLGLQTRDAQALQAARAASQDASDRVRRDIEQRVLTLRRAREQAERWVPPPVDAVALKQRAADADDRGWADTLFPETRLPDDEPPQRAR